MPFVFACYKGTQQRDAEQFLILQNFRHIMKLFDKHFIIILHWWKRNKNYLLSTCII